MASHPSHDISSTSEVRQRLNRNLKPTAVYGVSRVFARSTAVVVAKSRTKYAGASQRFDLRKGGHTLPRRPRQEVQYDPLLLSSAHQHVPAAAAPQLHANTATRTETKKKNLRTSPASFRTHAAQQGISQQRTPSRGIYSNQLRNILVFVFGVTLRRSRSSTYGSHRAVEFS